MKLAFLAAFTLMVWTAATSGANAWTPHPPEPPGREVLQALTSTIALEIGVDVQLDPTLVTERDGWGWVICSARLPDGTLVNWSQTRVADRDMNRVRGNGGIVYALLRRENGVWRVIDYVVGPTDVVWTDWPTRYGVPADFLTLPPAP